MSYSKPIAVVLASVVCATVFAADVDAQSRGRPAAADPEAAAPEAAGQPSAAPCLATGGGRVDRGRPDRGRSSAADRTADPTGADPTAADTTAADPIGSRGFVGVPLPLLLLSVLRVRLPVTACRSGSTEAMVTAITATRMGTAIRTARMAQLRRILSHGYAYGGTAGMATAVDTRIETPRTAAFASRARVRERAGLRRRLLRRHRRRLRRHVPAAGARSRRARDRNPRARLAAAHLRRERPAGPDGDSPRTFDWRHWRVGDLVSCVHQVTNSPTAPTHQLLTLRYPRSTTPGARR